MDQHIKDPSIVAPGPVRRASRWPGFLTGCLVLAVLAGIVWWTRQQAAPPQAGGGRNAGPMSIVPETIGKGDIGVSLNALGTVTSLATVTIRSQISGYLMKISFKEGDEVKRTGEVLSIPVGEEFLGRVINPLGQPIDGMGPINAEEERVLELQAPSVLQRQPVEEPMQTGIKAIDAMTPIGRGQRQLVIGDRKTGKTAVCIDTILNQKANWESGDKDKQVRCIYVAIGQKGSTIAGVRRTLEEHGALDYTTIVAAPASDSAGFKWLAPFSGAALGQHWMYQGNHVLVIYDDLTKQAEAYRAISLLLRRPPGREAYPGDVFYLHSRLLERAAKLSDDMGAGSMTALPIIETKANDVGAFIPTNVISITDGQVFLESDLFNQGVRPAINVGVSVSRVGGAAQTKGMKKVAGNLRLDLASYRDLQAFAAFASDLDAASKAQLERGSRLVELLKQPESSPQPVEYQMVSIYLAEAGIFDVVPVEDVRRFEAEVHEYLNANTPEVFEQISGGKPLTDESKDALVAAAKDFQPTFRTSDGRNLGSEAAVEPLDESDVKNTELNVSRKTAK